tara:strand:- start:96 stop:2414 length:2319 start_codon:yes stop_codon:yes gene_type:complete
MEPEPEPEQSIYIPEEFYCPISGELINEPVTDEEGNTYEKGKIIEWLERSKTSPITRAYLDISLLSDNISMKRSIQTIREKLQEEQLKIDARIVSPELKGFEDTKALIELNQFYNDNKLFINIQVPHVEVRPPIDIVLCIDVSYSMFNEATLKGEHNESMGHGISVLSLTVTAAKTILNSLNDRDNISIVTYSSESRVIVNNIPCTPENKSLIELELSQLKPISNTNMWSGLIQSLDILRKYSPKNKNKGIMLLTDGIPNVEPPRGHEYMLEKYFREHNFKCMINCYGFGYNLDSELLLNLSKISGGDGYSFIPDASIMGSVLINGISNLFTTASFNPELKIQLSKGAIFECNQSDKLEININSLKYGKSKNLLFKIDTSRILNKSYEYMSDFSEVILSMDNTVFCEDKILLPTREYDLQQSIRMRAIDTIIHCIELKKYNDSSLEQYLIEFINYVESELKRCPDKDYINNILYDFKGQIKEGLNMTTKGNAEDWFTRWGIHYLRSLYDAYSNEICNNFKDRGIRNFTSPLFEKLRDEISTIFAQIPPPKPDIVKVHHPPSSSRSRGNCMSEGTPPCKTRIHNMSAYINQGGGCCSGDSKILMANGEYIPVSELKFGDKVKTYCSTVLDKEYTETGTVECIIKTKCIDGMEPLVCLNGLKLTPYHPIINVADSVDKWVFPISIQQPTIIPSEYVYTFVINTRKPVIIEGYAFSTLGHYLRGEVIYHRYFGTEEVINDLKCFLSYRTIGLVTLTKDMFIRGVSGDVEGIKGRV